MHPIPYRPRRRLLWLILLPLFLWIGGIGVGPLPPIGLLLDPVTGLWSVPRQTRAPSIPQSIPELGAPVEIIIDRRGVPHLYAATDLDAWRALGWMHARDRLFQLELQSRATAGSAAPASLGTVFVPDR